MYRLSVSLITAAIITTINCGLQVCLQKYRRLNVDPLVDIVHQHFELSPRMSFWAEAFCNVWPFAMSFLVHAIIDASHLECTSMTLVAVMLIRAFCCFATTLPLIKRNSRSLLLQSVIGGNGDLYVSGHVAFALTLSLVLWRSHPIVSVFCSSITLLLLAPLKVLTRKHYTNDVLVAIFVVLSVMHFHNVCISGEATD